MHINAAYFDFNSLYNFALLKYACHTLQKFRRPYKI